MNYNIDYYRGVLRTLSFSFRQGQSISEHFFYLFHENRKKDIERIDKIHNEEDLDEDFIKEIKRLVFEIPYKIPQMEVV